MFNLLRRWSEAKLKTTKSANVASKIGNKTFFLTSHATYFYVTEHVTQATIIRPYFFVWGGVRGGGEDIHLCLDQRKPSNGSNLWRMTKEGGQENGLKFETWRMRGYNSNNSEIQQSLSI